MWVVIACVPTFEGSFPFGCVAFYGFDLQHAKNETLWKKRKQQQQQQWKKYAKHEHLLNIQLSVVNI